MTWTFYKVATVKAPIYEVPYCVLNIALRPLHLVLIEPTKWVHYSQLKWRELRLREVEELVPGDPEHGKKSRRRSAGLGSLSFPKSPLAKTEPSDY